MNIAITSQDRERVTGHAGRCQHFWVYEIVSGEVHNKHSFSVPGKAIIKNFDFVHEGSPLDGVSFLITHGIGKKLQRRLKKIGITCLVTGERELDTVVHHFLEGTLAVREAGHFKHPHFHPLAKEKDFSMPLASTRFVEIV